MASLASFEQLWIHFGWEIYYWFDTGSWSSLGIHLMCTVHVYKKICSTHIVSHHSSVIGRSSESSGKHYVWHKLFKALTPQTMFHAPVCTGQIIFFKKTKKFMLKERRQKNHTWWCQPCTGGTTAEKCHRKKVHELMFLQKIQECCTASARVGTSDVHWV